MNRRRGNFAVSAMALAGIVGLIGCLGGQGNTDGGSGADGGFRNDVFVSDDTSTGSIDLEITNSTLSIGDTSPFVVSVKNARQQPVQQINVICDSEQGIAIISPQSGYQMTDSSGSMSGVIGCESPGSYQIACRLSVGANKREFATVTCTGEVPSGFEGFPGAAGGGLGGGSPTNGDNGGVRITEISFSDAPGETASSVDISQIADCDTETAGNQSEPFYDTSVTVTVENQGTQAIIFTSLQYFFRDYTIDYVTDDDTGELTAIGRDFESRRMGITYEIGEATDVGSQSFFSVPVFKAYGGGKWVGDPFDIGTGDVIDNVGVRTITVTLRGQTVLGEPIEVRGKVSAGFGGYNRCP